MTTDLSLEMRVEDFVFSDSGAGAVGTGFWVMLHDSEATSASDFTAPDSSRKLTAAPRPTRPICSRVYGRALVSWVP